MLYTTARVQPFPFYIEHSYNSKHRFTENFLAPEPHNTTCAIV